MKKLSVILSLVLVIGIFAGCSKNASVENQATDDKKSAPTELVISTWGFNEDLLWENVFTPFEEANNVKIVLETGNNSDRLTKLKTNPNSNIDVMYLAEAFAEQGIQQGLFEEIDYAKVPNANKIIDKAQYLVEAGYGPAYTLNRASIVYSPSKLGFEINSWADLWKPELAGKVSIPEVSTTFGPHMMYVASNYKSMDITKDNGEAAFTALGELKPNILKTYTKSSDLANMFANDEIQVAVAADFAFGRIKAGAEDVVFADPKEGSYINFNTINIVKGSKNKELALKFLDYALSTEVQTRTAKSLDEAPVNSEVKLTNEEAGNLTYGDKIKNTNVIDQTFTNGLNMEWIDQWNRLLNQ